jgi:hypothetical protein
MTNSVGTGRGLTLKYWLLLILMIGFFVVVGAESAMRFLDKPMSGDFKHFYYAAYGVVHDQNIYTSGEPYTGVHWYAYFPLFAVALSPLVWMGLGGAGAAWSVINALLIVVCVYIAVRESVTRLGMKADPNLLVGVAFLVVLVFMDKFRSELRMGQSDASDPCWFHDGWIGQCETAGDCVLAVFDRARACEESDRVCDWNSLLRDVRRADLGIRSQHGVSRDSARLGRGSGGYGANGRGDRVGVVSA